MTVGYTATPLLNRVVTASAVDFGNVLLNGTMTGISSLTTSGDNSAYTAITVNSSVFARASDTSTYVLTKILTSYGTIGGSQGLTVVGEGLIGETPVPVNVSYTANVGNATADNSNSPTTFGAALAAFVNGGSAYANLESRVFATTGSGGAVALGTVATLLAGTNMSTDTTVNEAWRTRTIGEVSQSGGGLISDVVNLTGISLSGGGSHDGTQQTDMYVLQMSYSPAALSSIWNETESQAAAQGLVYLSYFDPTLNRWVRAVTSNFGGTPNYVGDQPYNSSDFVLGDYGVDTTDHVVWAVLNYDAEFAVVPEPGTLALHAGAAGLLGWLLRRRFGTVFGS